MKAFLSSWGFGDAWAMLQGSVGVRLDPINLHLLLLDDLLNQMNTTKYKKCWFTLPETNSSHLKMDGWNTIVSFWGPAYFQGRLLLVSGRVFLFHSKVCKANKLASWIHSNKKLGRFFLTHLGRYYSKFSPPWKWIDGIGKPFFLHFGIASFLEISYDF